MNITERLIKRKNKTCRLDGSDSDVLIMSRREKTLLDIEMVNKHFPVRLWMDEKGVIKFCGVRIKVNN